MESPQQRIAKALSLAMQYGGVDGDHHKDWTIDQMVRALCGCPMVQGSALDCNGYSYNFMRHGESEEYKKFVHEAKFGIEGEEYEWNEGTAP